MRIGIPYKRFIFFILMLCVFALIQPADAKIKGSKNIETLQTIKLLDKFPTLDKSFPSHLDSDRDVYVVYYAAASSSDFYVLTRPSVEPIRLARVVETAIKGTPLEKETVYYLHYGVYSWADVYSEHPKMWSRSAETSHRLGTMLAGLRKAGFKPHTLLCVFKSAKVPDELNKVKHSGRKWNVINVTNTSANLNFTLRTSITKSYFTRVILTTFAVPLIGIIAMPVLIIIAKSKRSTPEGRRSYFTGRYFWMMIICLFVSITTQSNLIFSPMRLKLYDMWSGLGLPLLFLLFLVMLPLAYFVLIAVSKLVAHLVFPGYSDTTAKKPFRCKTWAYTQFALIMAVFLVAGWLKKFLPESSLFVSQQRVITMLLYFLLASFITRSIHIWRRMPGQRTPNADLLLRLSDIASSVGFHLRGVAIVDVPLERRKFETILIRNGVLLIRCDIAEKLLPEEFDFAAAHEIVHAARRHHLKSVLLLIVEALSVIIPGYWLITQPFSMALLKWTILPVAAGFVLMLVDTMWLSNRREKYADRTALNLTHNAEAALHAVTKMSGVLDITLDDVKDIKPTSVDTMMLMKRLKWLRELSGYTDSEALSVFGGTKEDEALTKRAKDIAASMGVTLNKVMVLVPALNKPLYNAGALCGARMVVGQTLLEQFSDEEVDFVIAHELAHLKRRHLLKTVSGFTSGFVMISVGAALLVYQTLIVSIRAHSAYSRAFSMGNTGVWIALLGIALFISSFTWFSRRRETEADKMALRFTRNLPAAISTLVKLNVQNKIEIPEELEDMMTHPKINYRLQSLRDEAKRLGLPDIESEEQIQV